MTKNWNQNDGVVYVKSGLNATCSEINLGQATRLQLILYQHGQTYNTVYWQFTGALA